MTGMSSAGKKFGALSESKTKLLKLLLAEKSRKTQKIKPYPRAYDIEKILLPMSGAQRRLWFINQLDGSSSAYHISITINLQGALDRDALKKALDTLVQRHETLRTVFVSSNGEPLQEISLHGNFSLKVVDLKNCDAAERETLVYQQQIQESREQFDLGVGPLIRGRLLQLGSEQHAFLVTMHHIVSDGWSMGVFFREFVDLYAAYREGRSNPLPPLPIQYVDYALWQQKFLRDDVVNHQLDYWRARLAGAAPQLDLPTDRPRPACRSHSGESLVVSLDAQLTAGLKRLAHRHEMTLFMVLYAGWSILLARLSGQDDLVIGAPIANRQLPELEGLIGFFVNTLALRVKVQETVELAQFLEQVRELTLEAYGHQDVPFEQVVDAIRPQRSLNINPIFQVMFVLQNSPRGELKFTGLTASLEDSLNESSMFDLLLALEETGSQISGVLNYATDILDRSTVGRWLAYFKVLLQAMVDQDHSRICDLQILPEAERNMVVKVFNDRHAEYPPDQLVHQMFEYHALRRPDAVAVIHNDQFVTYEDLNRRANKLARYLRSYGIRPGKLVGISVERSLEMVVGLLGVLKAGGAYMPMDPSHPAERLQSMLKEAVPNVLLTQEKLRITLPTVCAQVIALDSDWQKIATQVWENLSAEESGATDRDSVYVIYTSGSTGRPKGTAMPHRPMVNLLEWHREIFGGRAGQRVLQFAALSFDVAFQETFSTLSTGSTLILLDEWMRKDASVLMELVRSRSVERLFLPPLMLQSLAEAFQNRGVAPVNLRDVITAGEQLRITPEITKLFKCLGGCRLHNHYGPTETHVVAALTIEGSPDDWPTLPNIGRPISNAQIYVLDCHRQPVPVGVAGEIYIGGAGVGRGYLNRPDLSAERFIADPYSKELQGRMYKTGDLGRWRADGSIEYLGRNDHQVKIRGFRIELGEIEAQLARHEQVKEAVVLAREDAPGQKRLVGYVLLREPGQRAPGVEELRSHLKQVLPEYMVPGAMVVLEQFPLTPNGKLDRRALPAPEQGAYASREYEAPQGEVEEILAGIWQGLLSVERVGRQDNFFELGGHSLLIVQMMERLRRVGLSVGVREIYASGRLSDLASALSRGVEAEYEVPPSLIEEGCERITPLMLPLVELEPQQIQEIVETVPGGAANIQDIYPLAPLQEGILFHHLLNQQGEDPYARPMLLSLSSRERLEAFVHALQLVIDRHDVLRTGVLWERLPRPVQVVYRRASLPVERIELDEDQDALEQMKERMRPDAQRLDLRQAPLMRLQIAADPGSERWYALLQTHHLVFDNGSLDVLLSEVQAYLEDRGHELPEPLPYRNHVAQALAHARKHDAEAFFRQKLADIEEPTAPFGLLDARGEGSRTAQVRQQLEAELSRRIRIQARRLGVSTATLFHAAWGLVVARTSAREDVVFGAVLLGRLQGSAGAQRILGMFINTLPLRLRLQGVTARELVEQTQRELVELLGHEQSSLAVAQRCSGIVGSAPLFSTLLNYLHSAPGSEGQWLQTSDVSLLASHGETNYPITLSIDDQREGFELQMQTDSRIDPHRLTVYMSTALQSLVEALEKAPGTKALLLSVLPPSEREQLLERFNATQVPYPQEKLIQELFEEQVERTPDATAVVYEGQSLTYTQLNGRANQLARYLRERGVGAEQLVGICVERSLEMVVGLLGILKSGAAYVPLDPAYPPDRLSYMLRDAGPRIVLTQQRLRQQVLATAAEVIELDGDWCQIEEHQRSNLDSRALGMGCDDLAYVIYTSGSTGKPKGAMNAHRGVVNRMQWMQDRYQLGLQDRVLQKTPFSFDVSVWEFFWTLLNGARLIMARPEGHKDPAYLWKTTEELGITTLHFVPSMLQSFLDQYPSGARLHLGHIVCSGEELPATLQRKCFECLPQVRLSNLYGPTEAAVDVTSWECQLEERGTRVPIGRPISNIQMYVLDRHYQPMPLGVLGEIYIGGAGVGRGYLNRPDLSAERFIADPYSKELQGRMYKTGDLGRWRADGSIEYLGRNDHQVKIRGFRIELGEIEAQLARHEQVKEAVVLAREDAPGQKRLVGYVLLREPGQRAPGVEELRSHLKQVLPEYMVPGAMVVLEQFPLTPNGKLDRRALPAPEQGAYASREYEAPQGEVEEILAGIWQGLLSVERVGRQDNFFELGGHSLLIVQMMERLRRVGLSVGVREIYASGRLSDLASALSRGVEAEYEVPPSLIEEGCERITPLMLPLVELEPQQIQEIVETVPGGAANIQDIYPLAPLQEGILFHHLLNQQGEDPYARPMLLSLSSRERLEAFVHALQLVIDRHDVLRTGVLWERLPRPVQVVYRRASLPVERIELDEDQDALEQMKERMRPDAQRLDLRQAPLMRLQIAADPGSERWYALLQTHHLVFDNGSLDVLLSEVQAYLEDRGHELPEPLPYRNHVAQALAHARKHDAEAFFRQKLADIEEPTAPFGLLDARGEGSRTAQVRQQLEAELSRRIRIQARRLGVSTATLFHAAWGLVVARTSAREDVVFGAVLLGRLQGSAGAQRILGMFINTLPLRLRLQGVTARELVEQTQRELVELLGHEQSSLAVAQRCSGIVGSAPLFSTLLNYLHSAPGSEGQWLQTSDVSLLASHGETNYPITLSIDDQREGFELQMQTDSRIDPHRLTVYMSTALQSLVEALEKAPGTKALLLSVLPPSEREQLLERFNATQVPYPQEKLIQELFEEQVERTPDATAVVYEGQSLTYTQLNGRANQLARYLRERGVGAEQLVGICVERSLEMVVGLLGILKSGAAYVPLDPAYPPDRLSYMLRDAGPRIVLTQQRLRQQVLATAAEVIELDGDWCQIEEHQRSNLDSRALGMGCDDLAYVIYTSGSTGKPKGAMNAHRGVVNRMQWMQDRYQLGLQDRVLQKTPFSFDVSVWEFFWTLLNGARLIMARPEGHKDPAYLWKTTEELGITTLHFVPSMLQSFLDQYPSGARLHLGHIVCSGEELPATLQRKCFECLPQVRLSNLYGPTEAAVDVTSWECQLEERGTRVPIGRPISNIQMYVLDRHYQPMPLGVLGEIYIGGAGVGRGYLNRPDLSAERFIADPYSKELQGRMYKTGDLGRWRADGSIEYLGRNDHQVKIRGFRIELGEIEAQLARHEQVKEAVVLAREDAPGQKRLVGYVLLREPGQRAPGVEELRSHLKQVLPEYMVPGAMVVLEQFPLTPNGKLDRRALPAPEQGAYASREYEAPQGEVEEILAGIWQGLLSVERVGRQDNFFELGGHSLLIVQMMERLRRVGLSVGVREIYASGRLSDLASALSRGVEAEYEVPPSLIEEGCERITPLMLPLVELEPQQIQEIVETVPGGAANIQDIYPLAPLQEGILFHHLLNQQGEDPYARPMLLSLSSRERLEAFVHALQLVIDRHDVLRTGVLWERLPRPVQVVYRRASLPVERIELDEDQDALEQMKERMRPDAQRLDLRQAPLMRLQIAADPGSERWYALLQTHHLVFDNGSLDVLLSEVQAYLEDRGHELPEPLPYRNHVAQALAHARKHDAEAFFRQKLADIEEPTAPFGLLDARGEGSRTAQVRQQLEAELSRRIRIQARRLGVSTATLFHAAWGLVVARTSAREDVVFGAVLLGRLQGSAGAQRILGMFINTLPLRLRLQGVTARELVEQTQRELVELLGHEQSSLAVAQRCSGIVGSAPLFSTLLNYLHSAPGSEGQWLQTSDVSLLASHGETNYPITLSIDDQREGFELQMQTDSRIDPHRLTVYMSTALQSLVEALEKAPGTKALLLSVLPPSEREQLLERFNATQVPYPQEKLIQELFEEQVERTPDATAVVYKRQTLTYAELNARANQLARYLRARGVAPDFVVGLCIERTTEMLVGLLGILKAGGAYVALDPNYPDGRLQYMVNDTALTILLTQQSLKMRVPYSKTIIEIDSQWPKISEQSSMDLAWETPRINGSHLAYVIYTSGSTGKPKGVAIEHRNAVNFIYWAISSLSRENFRQTLHSTSLNFDLSVYECFVPLSAGGSVRVVENALALTKESFGVTLINTVPSAMRGLIDSGNVPETVRVINLAGEALKKELVGQIFSHHCVRRVCNLYGPSETTTYSTWISMSPEEGFVATVGRPISNTQIYVLDCHRQPVPVGVAGEIYIGGAGVGRGYLNRPDLSAERFIADPYSKELQGRMYKTGDLGRWRADGSIEYLGRNDHQVKIRGFRIELGEIEAQLARHEQVKEAVVLAREDAPGQKRLVGYVLLREPGQRAPGVEELRSHLKQVLPEYMVPGAMVVLEQFPLTPNGKLDRRALPAPEQGAYASREYEAPQGEVEEILAGIWQGLLSVERVGRQDNFFELGGHSLHGIQLVARVAQCLSVKLPVTAVFRYPTIATMANEVESLRLARKDAANPDKLEFEQGII